MPSSPVQAQGKGFSVTFFRLGNKKMIKNPANATMFDLSRIALHKACQGLAHVLTDAQTFDKL